VIDPVQFARQQRESMGVEVPDLSDVAIQPPATIPPRRGLERLDQVIVDTSPASPRWRAKIPPPEPLGDEVDETPTGLAAEIIDRMRATNPPVETPVPKHPNVGQRRVAIYYGKGEDRYMVCVEEAPEFDIVKRFSMSGSEVEIVARVVAELGVKVKDTVGVLDAE
jgi:hypothetical protein